MFVFNAKPNKYQTDVGRLQQQIYVGKIGLPVLITKHRKFD